jgi:hypothetical protein
LRLDAVAVLEFSQVVGILDTSILFRKAGFRVTNGVLRVWIERNVGIFYTRVGGSERRQSMLVKACMKKYRLLLFPPLCIVLCLLEFKQVASHFLYERVSITMSRDK